jgi:hypothetical protein
LEWERQPDQLPLVSNAELGANVGRVRADGLDTELQGVCDLAMRLAPGEILQHFRLTRSQGNRRRRAASLNQMTIDIRKHASAIRHYVDGSENVCRRDVLGQAAGSPCQSGA